jgi:hypothetical protein
MSRTRDTFDITVSGYHNKNVRTTVTLDDDVHEAALHLSRTSGKRLGQVLSELVRRGLARPDQPQRKRRGRFPTFNIPPDAPVIPASRVQQIIDEEGYI